jgi:tol-pal system protein YbgF
MDQMPLSMSHLFCLTLLMVTFGGLASAQEPISLGTVTPPRAAASASPASLMDLQDKLTTLESSLQAQTQQIEDLQKTVQTLEQKLAQPPEAPAPTENETATAPDNTPNNTIDVSPENDAAESSDEISPAFGQAKPSQPLESTADATPAQADPYQTGIDALKQGQYAKARDHFTTFIANNPEDKLVPNAYYWMGEAYYAEGNYRKSGETFLKAFQDYPDSPKAPDSLLKLGLSLQSAKQNKQACQSFDELLRRYPKANPTIIQRAKRAKASCA